MTASMATWLLFVRHCPYPPNRGRHRLPRGRGHAPGTLLPVLLLVLTATIPLATRADPFVVIVNPESEKELDRDDIREIYLGRRDDWVPLELLEDNPLRESFHDEITGRTNAQLRSHWSRQVFTGRGYPPEEIEKESEVVLRVSEEPAAIGYVSPDAVSDDVTVVYRGRSDESKD